MTIQDYERLYPSVGRRTLQRDLRDLVVKQLVVEGGSSATDPNRSYRIHPDL
jgi:hypothetical protein